MSSPKVYILQPWITNLLVNYEQLDDSDTLLAGQVLRVRTERDCSNVLQQHLKSKFLKVFSGSQFSGCVWATLLEVPDYIFFF